MEIAAACSAIALLAAAGWQMNSALSRKSDAMTYVSPASARASGEPSDDWTVGDELALQAEVATTSLGSAVLSSLITQYVDLQGQGAYSTSTGEDIAERMAAGLKPSVSYRVYTQADVRTDSDTSYERMMRYRADLQTSLAPLMKNTQPEFEIFAQYVDTKDPAALEKLRAVGQYYADAAEATAKVIAPADAAPYHAAILNAMQEFGATLSAMADNAGDPFAAVAYLRAYNQAEADMLSSFNALVAYEKGKLP